MNVSEIDGSRSRLLEKSFVTICICCYYACLSLMLIVVVYRFVILVCMYLYTHKLLVMLVTCCKNRAAFVCVGGLDIVVALDFIYC